MPLTGKATIAAAALVFALLVFSLLVSGSLASPLNAQDTKESVEREISKPMFRGGAVFKSYCGLCHGERGDGSGRAAKLYADLPLAINRRSPEYYEKIVRRGGPAVGGSAYMPPWQDELSEEQIADVVAYVAIVSNPVRRGEVVYKANCILCHGVQGDGKGRAASLYHPAPADLTHSDKNDEYKFAIIRLGGPAMGRSSAMPPWQDRLTNIEVRDLVGYLETILEPPLKP